MYGEPDDIKRERIEKNLIEDLFYSKSGTKYQSGKTSTYGKKIELKNSIVSGFKEY